MKADIFRRALTPIALLLFIGGMAGYALRDKRRMDESSERRSTETPAEPSRNDAPKPESVSTTASAGAPAARPPAQSSGKALEEPALMATLRELNTKDPEGALRLARETNERFPDSQDAAERAWIIVKSLDSLKRFHEGQAEARVMVERYRGTSWAADVERHTLVYPLDQPSREEMQARERQRSQPH